MTWTYRPRGSFKTDFFPEVPGPVGTAPPEQAPQLRVTTDRVFQGHEGDALKVFLYYYPGDINDHVRKVRVEMKKRGCTQQLTVGEWVVFLGLLIAATRRVESGRELWDRPQQDRLFREHAHFGRFMTRTRFEDIKGCSTAALTDETMKGVDKWYRFRCGLQGFNENRRRTVRLSEVLVPDETMSGWKPRSTKHGSGKGKLAHLSFVPRKPKAHGTEFKTVCDGRHGVMLFAEIQEGKVAMESKGYRDQLAPNSATGMRLALGATGK